MNDFDLWNEQKKKIYTETEVPNKYPKVGEVWMSSLGLNIGYEQNGSGEKFSRPVLIIKKFNNHVFWAIPLSSRQKDLDFYFNYTDQDNQKISAILAQLKMISVKRLKRKMYDLPADLLLEIQLRLQKMVT